MLKLTKKQWLGVVGAVVAVLLGLTLCLQDSATWPNWFSAIGTIGAVFAAVWATFAAEDRQHRDTLQAAQITASTVTGMIARLVEEVESIEATLEHHTLNGKDTDSSIALRERLESLKGPTEEQLLRLAYAPENIAISIITAFGRIQSAADALDQNFLEKNGYRSEQAIRDAARDARPIVHLARKDLERAHKGINEFLGLVGLRN